MKKGKIPKDQEKLNEILKMLANEETRLDAASRILRREVSPTEINITQHLIGIMTPEQRLSNLFMEWAAERGIETKTVSRKEIFG